MSYPISKGCTIPIRAGLREMVLSNVEKMQNTNESVSHWRKKKILHFN